VRGTATLLLVLLGGGLAVAADAKKVAAIRFEGNRRYTEEFLREQIATKVGEPVDAAILARDERRLRDFFSTILEVETLDREEGVEVVFHVVDKSVVGSVDVRGVSRLAKADYEPLLLTRRGRPLQQHTLESDRKLLERLHREKGYHFCEVTVETRRAEQPEVEDVVFQVFVQQRVKVREVVLEGAASLPRRKVLQGARNSDRYRYTILGWITPSYFDRTALEEDRARIELVYKSEGFLEAKAVLVDVGFDDERRFATIRYRITEGPRYELAAIAVAFTADEDAQPAEPDRAFLDPKALEGLGSHLVGRPFREEDLSRFYRDVQQRLFVRAYAASELTSFPQPDPATRGVTLRIAIRCRPKVRLGRIRLVGNQYTKDNVLRREFRDGAYPGDPLDVAALEQGFSRIRGLQYFNVVRPWPPPYGLQKSANLDRADEYDVELEVEEADTRNFNVGAGVSSDGGVFASLTVTWRNFDIGRPPERPWAVFDKDAFRGGGQFFEFSASPGTVFSTFRLTFRDPAIRDSRWSFGVSLFRSLSFLEDYHETRTGTFIEVGRYLDERRRWRLEFEWMLREVVLDDPDAPAPVNALDAQGSSAMHGLGVTVSYDRRTEVGRYLGGHMTSVAAEVYGGPLGADVDIVKLSLDHRRGWRTYQQNSGNWHRLSFYAKFHWAGAYEDTTEVPIFERYFAGGRDLRGFEFREIGPRSNGRPTGGEFRALVSTQYTIPLSPPDTQFGLDLHFFVDQGSVTETFGDFDAPSWRIAVGFGFSIAIAGPTQPPIEIDFGFPLHSVDGDSEQVISLSFSRTF